MSHKRIAVVTGAAQGIGLETVRQLAEAGLYVVLTARTRRAVDAALAQLAEYRGRVEGQILDIADDASVAAIFDGPIARHGRLDVLVNNAARLYSSDADKGTGVSVDLIAAAIDNNSLGAWRMMQRALPSMEAHGYGRIVNVSSGMGALNDMGSNAVAYRVSKTALNALTRIASGLTSGGVKVNAVCPGWVRTEMGGRGATREVADAAKGIAWAATLPSDGPNGGFFRDGRPIPW